jgi:hypothetical protein
MGEEDGMTMPMAVKQKSQRNPISLRSLAGDIGVDWSSLSKWCDKDCVDIKDADAVRACALAHKSKPREARVDPKTGLPWAQAKAREETLSKRAERKIKEKEQSDAWVTSDKHFQVLTGFCARLEQIPGKAKSSLGLSEEQRVGLQKIIDDMRADYAKEVG